MNVKDKINNILLESNKDCLKQILNKIENTGEFEYYEPVLKNILLQPFKKQLGKYFQNKTWRVSGDDSIIGLWFGGVNKLKHIGEESFSWPLELTIWFSDGNLDFTKRLYYNNSFKIISRQMEQQTIPNTEHYTNAWSEFTKLNSKQLDVLKTISTSPKDDVITLPNGWPF